MVKAFLSYKQVNPAAAQKLVSALSGILREQEVFAAGEILDGGEEFRKEIDQALRKAKCFILLYGDPALDWSWCFYEAGRFAAASRAQSRPIYCLLPNGVEPPSPLANLQTIRATPADLEKWIRNALCPLLKRRQPTGDGFAAKIAEIENLINENGPIQDKVLKPYIWIEPPWPGEKPDWNATDNLPEIDFGAAIVSIDDVSATKLGFQTPPRKMRLLTFLRRIACESNPASSREEFWIRKVYDSLREAVCGKLNFQEVAYFRHEKGDIHRPIVVSVIKNATGTVCKLRILFASAFGAPLTESPSTVQRMSDGIRLAVRTRLEVFDPFLGRMAEVHQEKVLSKRPQDAIARRNPVGSRVIEALEAIQQEAAAHGFRTEGPPPVLFEGLAQQSYESIRTRGLAIWGKLKQAADEEDKKGTGAYPECERLLRELKDVQESYLEIALPRLRELLVTSRDKPSSAAA